jgi:GNAT superfamily N-acetyltransferase
MIGVDLASRRLPLPGMQRSMTWPQCFSISVLGTQRFERTSSEENSGLGAGTVGEIDSMFILASYRRLGIGRKFLPRCMEWFGKNGAQKVITVVAVGNEEVCEFYGLAGFLPLAVLLQRKE